MTLARPQHEAIDSWERNAMGFPQVPCRTRHRFADGVHGREVTVPADTLITGRKHRGEHLFVMSKGKVAVIRNGVREVIQAPYAGINPAGTRQIGYVIEEMVWETFHPNPDGCTDVAILEERELFPIGEHLAGLESPSPEVFALLTQQGAG